MIVKVTTIKLKVNILARVGLDLISLTIHLEGYLLDWSTISASMCLCVGCTELELSHSTLFQVDLIGIHN